MMIKYVSPDTFVSNTSSVILWTAIVGGFGTVIGPVLGGIIMQVLPEALRFLGDWRLVVYGVILLVVILRFPGGLYPTSSVLSSAIVKNSLKRLNRKRGDQNGDPGTERRNQKFGGLTAVDGVNLKVEENQIAP